MIPSKNGIEHAAVFSDPNHSTETPVVILAAGSNSGKDLAYTSTYGEKRLNSQGFATLRFDAYGLGESTGDKTEVTLTKDVQGLIDIVAYIRNKLGYQRVSAIGTSYGGQTTLLAAARLNPSFECLALRAPVSNYKAQEDDKLGPEGIAKWKAEGDWHWPGKADPNLRVKYAFYEDASQYNSWEEAPDIHIPVLIVHGDKDEAVDLEQSQKLVDQLPEGKLIVVKGAGHSFSEGTAYQDSFREIEQFLKEHLT